MGLITRLLKTNVAGARWFTALSLLIVAMGVVLFALGRPGIGIVMMPVGILIFAGMIYGNKTWDW